MDIILNQPDIPHKEESSDLWLYSEGKDILQNFGNELIFDIYFSCIHVFTLAVQL